MDGGMEVGGGDGCDGRASVAMKVPTDSPGYPLPLGVVSRPTKLPVFLPRIMVTPVGLVKEPAKMLPGWVTMLFGGVEPPGAGTNV